MDSGGVSRLKLWWKMLLENFKYKFWGGDMFSFLLDKNMEIDMRTLRIYLTLEDLTILFSKLMLHFPFSSLTYGSCTVPDRHQYLVLSVILILAIRVGFS